MTQPPASVSPSVVKRIALRLDNGTFIACSAKWGVTSEKQAKLIPYSEGFEKGVVTDADVERMNGFVANLDNAAALRKRKSEQIIEVQPVTAAPIASANQQAKRPKTKHTARELPPWTSKAREIITKIKQQRQAYLFCTPVDLKATPDYYKVVVENHGSYQMDLGTLGKNLNAGRYPTPDDFARDMDTIWHNCDSYNGPNSEVGKLGIYCKNMWLRLWANSGLSNSGADSLGGGQARSRRMTAGQAPSKWEPQLGEPSDSKRSGRGKQRSSQPRQTEAQNGNAKRGMGEVVSSGQDRGPMDGERLKQLGAALEEMDENAMEGILDIVRSTGQFNGIEEDEIELDLDNLSPEALWKLDDYAKQVTGGLYNPDAAAEQSGPVHRGPVVEGDSDEETDDD